VLFSPVLLGLYTLAYIACACFKIKRYDSPLFHFLKQHRPTSILGRRPEHGTGSFMFIRASRPALTQKGWYCFVTNKTIKICPSQNKFIEASSMATANTSNIQLVHWHFSNKKCVDPLNAANIFYVHSMHFFMEFVNKATGLRL